MKKNKTFHKKKVWVVFICCTAMLAGLVGRLVYLMGFRSDYYYEKAQDLHERERDIKAARGEILDANGKVLAANRTVCTISVIHSQIREPEKVINILSGELGMDEETVRKRVEKVSSIERIIDLGSNYSIIGLNMMSDFVEQMNLPNSSLFSL